MTIETKFNVGDWVYLINHNKIEYHKIWKIEITILEGDKLFIDYHFFLTNDQLNREEKLVFATKEALIKSL